MIGTENEHVCINVSDKTHSLTMYHMVCLVTPHHATWNEHEQMLHTNSLINPLRAFAAGSREVSVRGLFWHYTQSQGKQ